MVTLDYPVIHDTERPRRKSQLFMSKPKIRFLFEMSFLGNNTLKPSVTNYLTNFTNIDFIILNAALSFQFQILLHTHMITQNLKKGIYVHRPAIIKYNSMFNMCVEQWLFCYFIFWHTFVAPIWLKDLIY